MPDDQPINAQRKEHRHAQQQVDLEAVRSHARKHMRGACHAQQQMDLEIDAIDGGALHRTGGSSTRRCSSRSRSRSRPTRASVDNRSAKQVALFSERLTHGGGVRSRSPVASRSIDAHSVLLMVGTAAVVHGRRPEAPSEADARYPIVVLCSGPDQLAGPTGSFMVMNPLAGGRPLRGQRYQLGVISAAARAPAERAAALPRWCDSMATSMNLMTCSS